MGQQGQQTTKQPGPKGKLTLVNPLPPCLSPLQVRVAKPRVFKGAEPNSKFHAENGYYHAIYSVLTIYIDAVRFRIKFCVGSTYF